MNYKIAKKLSQYFYYGWAIVFLGAVSYFFSSAGQTYSISTFIDSYITEFQFSRTSISTIYSIATIISGSLLVFMGRATDKFGFRKMLTVAGFMLAMACFFNSFISNLFMITLGFFLLRYFGQGSLTLIPGSLIPQWFDKKRALALSLFAFGNIIANMIVPSINLYLMKTFNWQIAWRFWGLLLLVIFVPLVAIFVVDQPEDIGLLPDNSPFKTPKELEEEIAQNKASSWTLKEALKTKQFWFIGIISMYIPMFTTGLMFHFFSIMESKGISEASTGFIIGLIALPGFVMPLLAGFFIDKMRSKYVLAITQIVVMVNLIFMFFVNSTMTAIIFMLIYGIAGNTQMITLNVIWPKYFGRQHLGSIKGAATVFTVIGSALGPIPFGLSYDLTGGYNIIFVIMALLILLSLGMSLSVNKPKKSI